MKETTTMQVLLHHASMAINAGEAKKAASRQDYALLAASIDRNAAYETRRAGIVGEAAKEKIVIDVESATVKRMAGLLAWAVNAVKKDKENEAEAKKLNIAVDELLKRRRAKTAIDNAAKAEAVGKLKAAEKELAELRRKLAKLEPKTTTKPGKRHKAHPATRASLVGTNQPISALSADMAGR